MRLRISGVDLLAHEDWREESNAELVPTLEVPLLLMSPGGLGALRQEGERGHGMFVFPEGEGHLEFTQDGETIMVTAHIGQSGAAPQTATAPYRDLITVWEHFCNEIRAYLWREVPQLREHPFWGAWLQGAEYEAIPGPQWRIS